MFAAVEFPSIENIVEWPNWFGSGALGFNKIAFMGFLAFAISVALFLVASSIYLAYIISGVLAQPDWNEILKMRDQWNYRWRREVIAAGR